MGMFRRVELPSGVTGLLLLHSMPGRNEPLENVWREIRNTRIDCIVSLASRREIREKSPDYADAIAAGRVPCDRLEFPITDFGVPEDRPAFYTLARDLATRLRAGQRLLIHCGAGIGRTGTLATCVLVALGEPLESAKRSVSAAGSSPETAEQRELIAWCAHQAGEAP
ncbi:protein-tyrosine phosphatase family protein [Meiothermus sp. PNK-Is4]